MKGESFFKLGSNFSNQLSFVDCVPKIFENCANVFLITAFANQYFKSFDGGYSLKKYNC